MSASKHFRDVFTKKHLYLIYLSDIRYRGAPGIDRINQGSFFKHHAEYIDIVLRKAHTGSYQFSSYQEKLISKGQNKPPRLISIPTFRDKLTLKALFEVLKLTFGSSSTFLHKTVDEIVSEIESKDYNAYLKLDVKEFYPSINHRILLDEIRKKIRKREILSLIENAISRATILKPGKGIKKTVRKGVPQGLSISNVLANIYMAPIDEEYSIANNYKYFRYVDDILILCQIEDIKRIKRTIINDLGKLDLEVHPENGENPKTDWGIIGEGGEEFNYLGYCFSHKKVSVKKESIDRLRESIIRHLTSFKYSNTCYKEEQLKWCLNLRITGCVLNDTKYGWLIYFSQINDINLLYSLDQFVIKQMGRFGVKHLTVKRFVRAYYEIRKNISNTKYIPNFDKTSNLQKCETIERVFGIDTKGMKNDDIEFQFKKRIFKFVKELEKDLAKHS
ncbi:MAG: reverse transcriptase domain-containing protein [Candidatus Hatepunaea meridiana]|nr:reverse transcriptase domain-containing protein [Candidatus Hatepunaea meridiana]